MANPHPNTKYLAPRFGDLPPEVHKELSSRGGKATKRAAQRNRMLREITDAVLRSKAALTPEQVEEFNEVGVDLSELTVLVATVLEVAKRAQTGDLRALDRILKMWGADLETLMTEHRIQTDQERLRIDSEKLKLLQEKANPSDSEQGDLRESLRELLLHPEEDRSIQDIMRGEDPEEEAEE